MIKNAQDISETLELNGEVYAINDHVYHQECPTRGRSIPPKITTATFLLNLAWVPNCARRGALCDLQAVDYGVRLRNLCALWWCLPFYLSESTSSSETRQRPSPSRKKQQKICCCKTTSGPAATTTGRSLRDKGKRKEPMVTALVQPGNGPDGVLRTVMGGHSVIMDDILIPHLSWIQWTRPISTLHRALVQVHSGGRSSKADKRSRDGTRSIFLVLSHQKWKRLVVHQGQHSPDAVWRKLLLTSTCVPSDSDLNDYIRDATQLPIYRNVGVTIIDGALRALSEATSLEEARLKLSEQSIKSLSFAHWTEGESHRMDTAVGQLGDDLRGMRKLFPKKSGGDITKFFYMFKGCVRHKTSARQQHDRAQNVAVVYKLTDLLFTVRNGLQHVPVSEQEENHRTKEKKPRGPYAKVSKIRTDPLTPVIVKLIQLTVFPDHQSSRCPKFLDYFIDSGAPVDSFHSAFATRTSALIFIGTATCIGIGTIAASPGIFSARHHLDDPPQRPTLRHHVKLWHRLKYRLPSACTNISSCHRHRHRARNRAEPESTMARCSSCKMACHTACLGLDANVNTESWKCLVCQNAESMAVSKILCCSLCQSKPRSSESSDVFSALDVWKLSEYNSFVHMICAVWHAELTLTTTDDLTRVEGIAGIPLSKRKRECAICHQAGVGVCTKCDQCSDFIHVSCAWSSGFKFGFEILPQRKRRPRESDLVKYAEHRGLMEPRIWCPEHVPTTGRVAYDASDIDPLTQLTALQTFLQHEKEVSADPGLRILRKARRLDSVMESVTKPKHATPAIALRGKNLDLEDGYMVATLSMLPESNETPPETPEPTTSTRRRRSTNTAPIVQPAAPAAPPTRARDRTRVRNPARNRKRGTPASKEKVDDRSADDIPPIEGDVATTKDLMPFIKDATPSVNDVMPPIKDAMIVDPQLVNSHVQQVSAPTMKPESSDVASPATTINNPRPRKAKRKLAKPPAVEPNVTSDQPNPVKRIDTIGKSQANVTTSEGEQAVAASASKQDMHKPDSSWQSQPGVTVPASLTPEHLKAVVASPIASASKPSPRETAPNVPRPPSKLRLTIKPAPAPPKPVNPPALAPIQPKPLEEDRHHILPAPAFSYLPPSTLSHPHYPQPTRPMSSSSSSSSPSSSQPMMTRLPSINHLDVFRQPISHLHPIPTVPTMSSSMYLPPISSLAQPRRQSPMMTLPPPPPPSSLLPARHPSPGHIPHPPNHLRFTAPLSTPPSFDAFARGAAATVVMNPVRRPAPSTSLMNPADNQAQSHQPANNSSPPAAPRKDILA
ncbi:hypothetical protein H4Q26_010173 [Puccinia striiformis f. sp. tritici PST-130]|nr:hypothetical protein H4Q26_010173 [Puccinia striiformis f. sp. tritici PST-130]